jgi:hypothetical protein
MEGDRHVKQISKTKTKRSILEPFEKFVDWRQCAAVMKKEAMTVMPSCSGGVT